MRLFVIFTLIAALSACQKKAQEEFSHDILFRMGTVVEITLPSAHKAEFRALDALIAELSDTITKDTRNISSTPDRVEITKLNAALLRVEQQ